MKFHGAFRDIQLCRNLIIAYILKNAGKDLILTKVQGGSKIFNCATLNDFRGADLKAGGEVLMRGDHNVEVLGHLLLGEALGS